MNGEAPRRYFGDVMRTAIVAVFAAAFTISVSAQDFMVESGVPASAFQNLIIRSRTSSARSGTTKRSATMTVNHASSCVSSASIPE